MHQIFVSPGLSAHFPLSFFVVLFPIAIVYLLFWILKDHFASAGSVLLGLEGVAVCGPYQTVSDCGELIGIPTLCGVARTSAGLDEWFLPALYICL